MKHKKTCKTYNYNKHSLILASTFAGCVSVSAFASLVDVSVGITSSAFGLKIFVITARLKKSIEKMVFILRRFFLAKGRSHDLHFLHHFQQLIFNKLPKDW